MEGLNPTPYFFVKEIFLNIIIALRRLFIIFLLYFKCFTRAIFFVCSFFVVVVFCLFLFLFFHPSHIIHFIIRLYNLYIYNTKEVSASNQFATNDLVHFVC